jgi:hypothetical protein
MKYKLLKIGNVENVILTSEDGLSNLSIPFSEDNSDYQAYLVWLSEGNTPLPADEPTPAEETNI